MATIILLGVRQRNAFDALELDRRCEAAARLYRRGARVIACGGAMDGESRPEARTMGEKLAALGVPPSDVTAETRSRTTMENLTFARRLIAEADGPVTIVTSDYHAFRTGVIAKRLGLRASLCRARIPFSAEKLKKRLMEPLFLADLLLGFEEPGAVRPAWTRLIMRLLKQEKP